MEFIRLSEDRYMVKDSNNRIVSKEDKLKLEKKELVLKDIKGCECQEDTTKEISKINEELKEIEKEQNNEPKAIKKTTKFVK